MTELSKIVKRRGTIPVHEIGSKRVIVQLEPGDVLAMRQENRRRWFRATFAELYRVLADIHASAEARFIRKRVKELQAQQTITRRSAAAVARREWEKMQR